MDYDYILSRSLTRVTVYSRQGWLNFINNERDAFHLIEFMILEFDVCNDELRDTNHVFTQMSSLQSITTTLSMNVKDRFFHEVCENGVIKEYAQSMNADALHDLKVFINAYFDSNMIYVAVLAPPFNNVFKTYDEEWNMFNDKEQKRVKHFSGAFTNKFLPPLKKSMNDDYFAGFNIESFERYDEQYCSLRAHIISFDAKKNK